MRHPAATRASECVYGSLCRLTRVPDKESGHARFGAHGVDEVAAVFKRRIGARVRLESLTYRIELRCLSCHSHCRNRPALCTNPKSEIQIPKYFAPAAVVRWTDTLMS